MKAALSALLLFPRMAFAATLLVGPGQRYTQPSKAIAAAHDGDTVSIEPGSYADCAIVRQNNLTVQGAAPGVVMAGKTCGDKAILIASGRNLTVRNLTLRGARSSSDNGAGIRAEGRDLTVERVTFTDDQNGILTTPDADSTVRVVESLFSGDGSCAKGCAHGAYFGHIARAEIIGSRFIGTKQGHSVKSRAATTIVENCVIEDGAAGTSSYAIDIPNGGNVLVARSVIEKGPDSSNKASAIIIGEEGVTNQTQELAFRDDRFINNTGQSSTFVRDRTHTPAKLTGNVFQGRPVTALSLNR